MSWDSVSRLIIRRTGVVMWLIGFIKLYLLSPHDPPSKMDNIAVHSELCVPVPGKALRNPYEDLCSTWFLLLAGLILLW